MNNNPHRSIFSYQLLIIKIKFFLIKLYRTIEDFIDVTVITFFDSF